VFFEDFGLDYKPAGRLALRRLVRKRGSGWKSHRCEDWAVEMSIPQRARHAAVFGNAWRVWGSWASNGTSVSRRTRGGTIEQALISCIIPVYNGEAYLREAIESVLAQTYRPIEIIVADDGSADRTAAFVAGYRDQVRYLFQPNAGTAAACNLGLRAAQGDFIAFLAADDLWHVDKLARQMNCFKRRPELVLCVTHVQNFWIPELQEEAERFRNHRISQPLPGYVPQTLLARRALFETVGHFNTALRHADSTDWFLRVIEHGAVIDILPDVLVYRRIHQSNLSRRMASASRQEYVELVKATLDRRRRQKKDN